MIKMMSSYITLSVGAEYRMAKNHSLSMQLQGSYNQGNNRQNYLFSVESSDGKYEKEQMSKIKDYSGDYTAGLFYRGTLWKKSRLNSDLTYNYYSVKKRELSLMEKIIVSILPLAGKTT